MTSLESKSIEITLMTYHFSMYFAPEDFSVQIRFGRWRPDAVEILLIKQEIKITGA